MSTTDSSSDLPSPRHFVTALVSGLREQDGPTGTNLDSSKQSLLTLHVLFQNELLPALDLLDRGLVNRLRCRDPAQRPLSEPNRAQAGATEAGEDLVVSSKVSCTYYVRSSQAQTSRNSSSRFRNAVYEHTTYYEVHLNAWSCSCPAFAFSALPASLSGQSTQAEQLEHKKESEGWIFGGSVTLGLDMPVCKHLLACVLVEHSSMFAHMVEEREVSMEEMAGWAAGWGD